MSFEEIRFPTDISYGSSGGPQYSTNIVTSVNGYEQRNINWSKPRIRYNLAYGVKSQAQLDIIIAFFRARKGRAVGFRFKDWTDYKCAGDIIGAGDGNTTEFQLVKNYISGSSTEIRAIQKPVANTVKIYFDDVLQNTGFTVDITSGIITFDTAPALDVEIKTDCEFDVPVRFDTDKLSASLDAYGTNSWLEIPIVELRIKN